MYPTPRSHLHQQGADRPGAVGDAYDRYVDPQSETAVVKIYPGGYYVTGHRGDVLMTVLGSCVAACVRDPAAGIGGMNHFMLPDSDTGDWGGLCAANRYGNFAMETVINEIMSRGGQRDRLEIKLFGGSNVLDSRSRIGARNVDFIRNYIAEEQLTLTAEDLGGSQGRRIHYFPDTGKVMRRMFKQDSTVERQELRHLRKLRKQNVGGDIELFE